jgi:hypothetical protein
MNRGGVFMPRRGCRFARFLLITGSFGFDNPIPYVDDPFGMFGNILVVGHQNDGDAFFLIQLLKNTQNFLTGFGIEVSGGFIGKKERRVVDQRPGNSHSLLLPAGEL